VSALSHRTAISRRQLSRPGRVSLRLLPPGGKFFDYGCGRGDDVRALCITHDAYGWDPHWHPNKGPSPLAYDVVQLAYVLNVIECPTQRERALELAWAAVRPGGYLVVAVRTDLPPEHKRKGWFQKADGWITSTGTFQKFFLNSRFPKRLLATLEVGRVTREGTGVFSIRKPS